MRNIKGQFVDGTKNETPDEKKKRISNYLESIKKSDWYLGDLKTSPLYNVWRGFRFTKKGKLISNSKDWDLFKNFFNDMNQTYRSGLRLGRMNKDDIFSKENCFWLTEEELYLSKNISTMLTYNGETKTLKEWGVFYGLPYNALKQRYNNKKGYTSHEILFGRKIKSKRVLMNENELSLDDLRLKAAKMVSSYKCSDKKKGYETDVTKEYVFSNIIRKPCIYCGSINNVGCDRLDNKRGHLIDNIVPCCYICNVVRSNLFTFEEMKRIGIVISDIIKLRNNE